MTPRELKQWVSHYRELYLFGAGAYGTALRNYLQKIEVSINSFVVSEPKLDCSNTGEPIISIETFRTHYISREVPVGLILTVDEKFYNEIVNKISFALSDVLFLDENFKHACYAKFAAGQEEGNPYDLDFYKANLVSQTKSARGLVEAILSFVKPTSVIDVGCGIGLIAKMFQDLAGCDVLGVDGDYIDLTRLQLDRARFFAHDLTVPFRLERRFDLCLSLEVAEHLDECHASQFVETLCNLSDIIVFSAAVPGQGGVHHVNEQPQSYWEQKFRAEGYKGIDCIRPAIWDDEEIAFWYKQNTILYIKDNNASVIIHPQLRPVFDIFHPDLFRICHKFGEGAFPSSHPNYWDTDAGVLLSGANDCRRVP